MPEPSIAILAMREVCSPYSSASFRFRGTRMALTLLPPTLYSGRIPMQPRHNPAYGLAGVLSCLAVRWFVRAADNLPA